MPVFAAIAPDGSEELRAAVDRAFHDNYFEFAPGQFVISAHDLTTTNVADMIGVEGQVGRLAVFRVASHWGYHRKDLWEWLAVHK